MSTDAAELVARLRLVPHPEGGFYREVYRSPTSVRAGGRDRAAVTTIYYLLVRGGHSRWHVVAADEVWHFYAGEPLELHTYDPVTGKADRTVLGPLSNPNAQPVAVVPAGIWQAAAPLGAFALVGCTVAPGFDFADFRFVSDLEEHVEVFAGALSGAQRLL